MTSIVLSLVSSGSSPWMTGEKRGGEICVTAIILSRNQVKKNPIFKRGGSSEVTNADRKSNIGEKGRSVHDEQTETTMADYDRLRCLSIKQTPERNIILFKPYLFNWTMICKSWSFPSKEHSDLAPDSYNIVRLAGSWKKRTDQNRCSKIRDIVFLIRYPKPGAFINKHVHHFCCF